MTSPLEEYSLEHNNRWDVLVDFPAWEVESIYAWVKSVLHTRGTDEWGNTIAVYNPQVLLYIQKKHRIMFRDLGLDISNWVHLDFSLTELAKKNPNNAVLLVELLVKYIRDTQYPHEFYPYWTSQKSGDAILDILEHSLSNGSKWTIVRKRDTETGLIERVDPHMQVTAEKLNNEDLDKAWSNAFGPNPNPSQAIVDAQLAIEFTASKYKLTKTGSKIYGTLLGSIRQGRGKAYKSVAKPEFDMGFVLAQPAGIEASAPKNGETDDLYADWFWMGMDIIQKSNPKRHKGERVSNFEVSRDAARQAVLMATLLCQMIKSEYIKRTPSEHKDQS